MSSDYQSDDDWDCGSDAHSQCDWGSGPSYSGSDSDGESETQSLEHEVDLLHEHRDSEGDDVEIGVEDDGGEMELGTVGEGDDESNYGEDEWGSENENEDGGVEFGVGVGEEENLEADEDDSYEDDDGGNGFEEDEDDDGGNGFEEDEDDEEVDEDYSGSSDEEEISAPLSYPPGFTPLQFADREVSGNQPSQLGRGESREGNEGRLGVYQPMFMRVLQGRGFDGGRTLRGEGNQGSEGGSQVAFQNGGEQAGFGRVQVGGGDGSNQGGTGRVENLSCQPKENVGSTSRNVAEVDDDSSHIDAFWCSICMEPWTNDGEHAICSLPCGHIYGMSCITVWMVQQDQAKCPNCNTVCQLEDVRRLYGPEVAGVQMHMKKLKEKIGLLETECALLQVQNAEWSRKESEWKQKETSLLLQLEQQKQAPKSEAGPPENGSAPSL